jgi:hypothetical protein
MLTKDMAGFTGVVAVTPVSGKKPVSEWEA